MDRILSISKASFASFIVLTVLALSTTMVSLLGSSSQVGAVFQKGGDKSRPSAPSTSPSDTVSKTLYEDLEAEMKSNTVETQTKVTKDESVFNWKPWIITGEIALFFIAAAGFVWATKRNKK